MNLALLPGAGGLGVLASESTSGWSSFEAMAAASG